MKIFRTLSLLLALTLMLSAFVGCTKGVPGPFEQAEAKGRVEVNAKIVVLETAAEGEDPVEKVLLEKRIEVTSASRSTLMLRDLFNALGDDGHIPSEYTGSKFKSIENYEANDTHMWYWALNGNDDVGDRAAIKNDDTIVLTYAEKGADIETDAAGKAYAITLDLKIATPDSVLYEGQYVIEGQKNSTIKKLLKDYLDKQDGILDARIAGSIKSINDIAANDEFVWNVYIDGTLKKASAKINAGDADEAPTQVHILYEEVVAEEEPEELPEAEEAPDGDPIPEEGTADAE